MNRPRPLILAICDGWGVAPDSQGNAITRANTPNFDRFLREFPVMTLYASGAEVGLDAGEMGNSEVGHLNIGAGRVYYQTFPRIAKSILDGSLFENQALLGAIEQVKTNSSDMHIVGLVSPGNVHASEEHLYAILEMMKKHKVKKVYIHAILDGRDVQQNTAPDFIEKLEKVMKKTKVGEIATLSGRYYAMDRDNNWDRIEPVYRAMVDGVSAEYFIDPLDAIKASYKREVYDEQFVPVVIGKEGRPTATVKQGDAVIFFNFRPDRARELTKAFVLPAFEKFDRPYLNNLYFTTFTEYEKELPVHVVFPPMVIHNCLAEVISKAGLKQYHAAETEKYAHVTFFLNGTIEEPFPGEERGLIPSPKVATYDQAPEMSAVPLVDDVVRAIESDKYDVIIMNFANADMVAHTGNLEASILGIEAVDRGLGLIADHTMAKGGVFLMTADHGNGEEVANTVTGGVDKEHSTNPVPFIIVGEAYRGLAGPAGDPLNGDLSLLHPVGMLADVAPTMLAMLGIGVPPEMTGRSLI
jgi:2,3-bisphosphoglycerate-independent phosphoglycerate mutase